jgi:branched-chain amino acid transport system ATP-binding protein
MSTTADHVPSASLETTDLTVRFGGIHALDHVSLRVEAQTCCGVIGPNGAGKTTFLDCLSGMRAPSSGTVALGGRNVTRRTATWLSRAGVRRTFQRHQAFGQLSVEDNVLVALEWRGRGQHLLGDLLGSPGRRAATRRGRQRVDEVIGACGLDDVRYHPASSLPLGQLRLLEFARATVDPPSVLLLDEPTSGIGPADRATLGAAVTEIRDRTGCTVLLVEHDVSFVMQVCERVIVLDQGRVFADGDPLTIQNDAAVAAAYLGQS